MSWLSALVSLVPFLSKILDLFEGWRVRREAREIAGAEVVQAEAKATREAAKIIAEHRDPNDAAQRLDKGTF